MSEAETGYHVIGRGDENSMVLDMDSVSREHGCFIEARCRWFFCDLGSTNGSWVNGSRTGPMNVRLLRNGDLVQLANVAIRVTMVPSDDARFDEETPALFVFHERKLKMELPLAGGASRLVLPDLQNLVTGDFGRLPAMTVVWRPGKIELVVASEDSKIIVNGVEWAGAAGSARELFDRDELDAGAVKIVISDLSTAKVVKERHIKAALAIVPPATDRATQRGYTREETKVFRAFRPKGNRGADRLWLGTVRRGATADGARHRLSRIVRFVRGRNRHSAQNVCVTFSATGILRQRTFAGRFSGRPVMSAPLSDSVRCRRQ